MSANTAQDGRPCADS